MLRKLTIISCAVILNILLMPILTLNSESDTELPEWETGYTWNYRTTGSVSNVTVNHTYKVIDTTNINLNGVDYEVYVVNSTSIRNHYGEIFQEYRDKYITKNDLSTVKVDISFNGPFVKSKIQKSIFNPPMMEFEFPLYLGKNGTINYNESKSVIGENDANFSRMSKYDVIMEETITVPAGTFECYKIKIENELNNIYYIWYSDEVKNIVKHTGLSEEIPFEVELNSYSLEAEEMDDEDTNPSSLNILLLIIVIAIIIVITIISIMLSKRRKIENKKKVESKRKSKKKKEK